MLHKCVESRLFQFVPQSQPRQAFLLDTDNSAGVASGILPAIRRERSVRQMELLVMRWLLLSISL
jgi:hypothetical protein